MTPDDLPAEDLVAAIGGGQDRIAAMGRAILRRRS
jgi:hypothetical protein